MQVNRVGWNIHCTPLNTDRIDFILFALQVLSVENNKVRKSMVGSHLTPPTVCAAMSTHYKMFIENKSLKLLNLMGNNLYISDKIILNYIQPPTGSVSVLITI